MYSRKMSDPPKSIIENGSPNFGSFNGLFSSLNITGLRKPFGKIPLPIFLTKLRIRSSFNIICFDSNYEIMLGILDAKIFAYTEIIISNKITKQKYTYRNVTGIRRRLIPKNLEKMHLITQNKNRKLQIFWDKEKNSLTLKIFAKGSKYRPDMNLSLANIQEDTIKTTSFCCPAPIKHRCVASSQLLTKMYGTMELNSKRKDKEIIKISGTTFFDIRRSYSPLRSYSSYLTGIGIHKGKEVFFRIIDSNTAATNSYLYNENFLYYDEELTLLPPVKITKPKGILGKWVIQDTESMIDLSFSPKSDNMRRMSIVILHTEYHCIDGNFNGVLKTNKEEEILIKDFSGIIRKSRLRF